MSVVDSNEFDQMKWFQHSIISHFLVSGLFIIINRHKNMRNQTMLMCVAGEWYRYLSKLRVLIQNPHITELCVV